MGPTAESIVTIAKGGAYAICAAAILYNFWQNNSLMSNASSLSKPVLESLQKHFRKTAWIGLVFFLAGGLMDVTTRFVLEHRAVDVNVQLQPSTFYDTVRRFPEMAGIEDPILAFTVISDHPTSQSFVRGLLRATLNNEQTISFDVQKLSDGMLIASEKAKYATAQLGRCADYGIGEPGK